VGQEQEEQEENEQEEDRPPRKASRVEDALPGFFFDAWDEFSNLDIDLEAPQSTYHMALESSKEEITDRDFEDDDAAASLWSLAECSQ
jgi:hypothetical protein